jgi:hypothetical protein
MQTWAGSRATTVRVCQPLIPLMGALPDRPRCAPPVPSPRRLTFRCDLDDSPRRASRLWRHAHGACALENTPQDRPPFRRYVCAGDPVSETSGGTRSDPRRRSPAWLPKSVTPSAAVFRDTQGAATQGCPYDRVIPQETGPAEFPRPGGSTTPRQAATPVGCEPRSDPLLELFKRELYPQDLFAGELVKLLLLLGRQLDLSRLHVHPVSPPHFHPPYRAMQTWAGSRATTVRERSPSYLTVTAPPRLSHRAGRGGSLCCGRRPNT